LKIKIEQSTQACFLKKGILSFFCLCILFPKYQNIQRESGIQYKIHKTIGQVCGRFE
jgi:hypothetical protein